MWDVRGAFKLIEKKYGRCDWVLHANQKKAFQVRLGGFSDLIQKKHICDEILLKINAEEPSKMWCAHF